MILNIRQLLGQNNIQIPIINIVNIGAMSIGIPEIYQSLVNNNMCRIIGFEPVKAECDKLNDMCGEHEKYLPYFIGDGKESKFYITNYTMTSSLYEPDTELLNTFQNLANLTEVVQVETVETKRLDDIEELPDDIDYIKIDVQGAEHLIFQNAPNVLNQAVLIQTEVEFVPMYKKQPLFADVDRILRSNNFEFHKFSEPSGRPFKPFIIDNDPNKLISQQLWADAIYVKNFMNLDKLSSEKIIKLAVILHEVYHSIDLCHFVLSQYDKRHGTLLADNYG